MNSIFTAIFSPRGSSTDRDAASPSPYPKSTPLPPKRTKRTSPPGNQARRSMLSLEVSNNEPMPTSPESRETRPTVQAPAKSPAKPPAKKAAKKPAKKIVKKPVKQPAKKTAKQLAEQLEKATGLLSAKVSLKHDAIMQESVETRVVNEPDTSTKTQPSEPAVKVEAGCEVEPEVELEAEPEVEPEVEPVIKYAFDEFTDHRWVGDSMEIRVAWQDGDPTWEREAVLHEDAPDALLAYWKSQGERPTNPNDPDLFNIFAVRKHTKDRKSLLVEWVGYGPKEASWLPRAEVEKTAPELVAQYWRSIKSARPRRRRK
ncbi:hypothetical protein E4U57_006813 [Claviceps arundinis]|uniref:Chromo domain-containing protein n=1 Tax=Claviceps arundinis TaxID=1623583 RepID=A0ABQ7PG76_9HYPO|nr:hypothetical protein E4U57_006813 [Claviceps arundinis]